MSHGSEPLLSVGGSGNTTFTGTALPATGNSIGDFFLNTSTGNITHYWDGSSRNALSTGGSGGAILYQPGSTYTLASMPGFDVVFGNTNFSLVKEAQIGGDGTVSFSFSLLSSTVGTTATARIYLDGVYITGKEYVRPNVGTQTFTDTIDVTGASLFQIYLQSSTGNNVSVNQVLITADFSGFPSTSWTVNNS